jgi:hypothetical protein
MFINLSVKACITLAALAGLCVFQPIVDTISG